MKRVALALGLTLALALVLVLALALVGWPASTRHASPSPRGHVTTLAALEALIDAPGPLTATTVVGADWSVDRAGVIDLSDPRAIEAGLVPGMEPIQVYMHVIEHPTLGTYLIDTGVEHALTADPDHAAVRGLVASLGHLDAMHVHDDTSTYLADHHLTVSAVLLTHLHLDHVSGLADVPSGVPVVLGAGDLEGRNAFDLLTQPSIDRALEGHPLEEWSFGADPDAVIDVLGDGSLWVLPAEGHTHGSVAFVARTRQGPILYVGDASHTAWGWDHDVPPGDFTEDHDGNVATLARLRALAARHPGIRVRLGHQPMSH